MDVEPGRGREAARRDEKDVRMGRVPLDVVSQVVECRLIEQQRRETIRRCWSSLRTTKRPSAHKSPRAVSRAGSRTPM